jgi:hypothetical protein
MFKTHQPMIARFMRKNPDALARGEVFTLCTIQKHFSSVGNQLKEIETDGINAVCLNGAKKRSYKEIIAMKGYLYEKVYSKEISLAEKLLEVSGLYGIGMVKAGFILQLALGKVGCLDVHNLARFGLSASVFKVNDKMTEATALRKANFYIKTCEDLGGSEYLWNTWCKYVADLYPKIYRDACHVSKLHVDFIIK